MVCWLSIALAAYILLCAFVVVRRGKWWGGRLATEKRSTHIQLSLEAKLSTHTSHTHTPTAMPPPQRHCLLVLPVTAVLLLLLLPSAQAFFPRSRSSACPTTAASSFPQPGLGFRLTTPADSSTTNTSPRSSLSSFLSTSYLPQARVGVRVLFTVATDSTSTTTSTNSNEDDDDGDDWVESPCPCTELGQGSSAAGPLTDRCDIGDVVVLVLPPSNPNAPSPLALAVVDGPNEVCLLCMRDPDCPEWYRDYRDEIQVLTDVTSAALVRVISDAYYSQRNIPSGGGTGYGADAVDCWLIDEEDLPEGLGRPLDFIQNAAWMFLG